MAEKTMIQAITEAMDLALDKDPKTLIFGEDVGQYGGVFRATDGLQAKYGNLCNNSTMFWLLLNLKPASIDRQHFKEVPVRIFCVKI